MTVKTFLVAGASGEVGEGFVAELLRQQHQVIAVVRGQDKEDQLTSFLNEEDISLKNLTFVHNAFGNDAEIEVLRKSLAFHTIDVAIASLGGWYHGGNLYEVSHEDLAQVIQGGLFAHLNFAKAVLPMMKKRESGNYIMINGGASEFPVPHSGIISVVAAAQKMMTQVLYHELKDTNVKVQAIAAFDLIKTRHRPDKQGLWLSPKEIVEYILKIIDTPHELNYWHKLAKPIDLQNVAK
ncbi:SDR family NAD(P)-dependent oxidoreductase [Catalinimonas sp. 4WD22]|uniref:SDR family NAD(P)-dependent oxidoreductase n=1 Tax=Catalinimonas locisalis TaxID=3133978 RepID=UPI003101221D